MKKILIPHDFSDNSENTLQYGIELAKELSADIILLHVTPYPVVTPETGLPAFSYKDMQRENLNELNKLGEKIKTGHTFPGKIESFSDMGDITESIVQYCKEHPIEFVVMGIYQHGNKLMKALIGSNAVETSHKTKCTVIVVPPGTTYKRPHTVALASDKDIQNQDTSLQKAKEITALFNAELQILHVVPENHHFAPSEVVIDNFFEKKEERPPHKLFIITEKKVSEGLLGMLDNKLIDMILIEPKEHNLFYKLFHESVSKELVFASPVPVVLIHS